jgi:hypothetical protein
MRYAIAVAVAVAIAIAVYLTTRGRETSPPTAGSGSSTSTSTSTSTSASEHAPPRHVTKIASPEERARIASAIAAARASTTHAAPVPPRLLTHETDVDSYVADTNGALKEVIPYLAACYEASAGDAGVGSGAARVRMTLSGDRDVGTLIDADGITDEHGQPIEAGLASCLKTTLESLELPPLAQGNKIKLEYSFRFSD